MVKYLIILLKKKKNNEAALISKLNMQLFYLYTYFPILPKKKENISIQVYEFFQCNQVQSKNKNIPLSTYEKAIAMITWIWRTNRLTFFCNKRC